MGSYAPCPSCGCEIPLTLPSAHHSCPCGWDSAHGWVYRPPALGTVSGQVSGQAGLIPVSIPIRSHSGKVLGWNCIWSAKPAPAVATQHTVDGWPLIPDTYPPPAPAEWTGSAGTTCMHCGQYALCSERPAGAYTEYQCNACGAQWERDPSAPKQDVQVTDSRGHAYTYRWKDGRWFAAVTP